MTDMKRAVLAAAACGFTLPALSQAAAQTLELPAAGPTRHILNFEDVAMADLIEDVSVITGYTFVVHPDARAKRVTVASNTPLSTEGIFEVFLSTLRVHGFAAVPSGRGVYRVLPETAAVGEARLGGGDFTTAILQLRHGSANEAAQLLKPLVDAEGQVIANAGSNTVVVVDYASNLPRLREVLEQFDADQTETRTLSLKNIPARELEGILTEVNARRNEDQFARPFRAVAAESGNAIVLSGDPAIVERAERVALQLDRTDRVEDTLRVIRLNNASVEEITPILQQVALAMEARRPGGLAAGAAAGGAAVPETTIAADPSSNSLVISAPPDVLLSMERIVRDLDQRRAQVLVEAVIVEISEDAARELGVQFLLSGVGEDAVPFTSTNFSRSAPNLLSLAGAIGVNELNDGTTAGFGDNPFAQSAINSLLGLSGVTVGVGGRSGDTLFGAIINAVESDGNSRILSKPFNMTLDNATSSLLVGQEVPVVSGQILGADLANAFQGVDRREIGIQLDVTPRISSDGTIRLDIDSEVSSIAAAIGGVTPDLIFNKRTLSNSVIADDGEIIVLGGLIEQTEALNVEKVPGLGDVPGLGRLFQSQGSSLSRTSLMVFIKPTIIRSSAEARAATSDSYRYIRADELWSAGEPGAPNVVDGFFERALSVPPLR